MVRVRNLLNTAIHYLLWSLCLRGEGRLKAGSMLSSLWRSKRVTLIGITVACNGGVRPEREERSGHWGRVPELQIKALGARSHPD